MQVCMRHVFWQVWKQVLMQVLVQVLPSFKVGNVHSLGSLVWIS